MVTNANVTKAGGIAAFFMGISLRQGGEVSVSTAPTPIPVTGQGMPELQVDSGHGNKEARKYPGDDEYGEEM